MRCKRVTTTISTPAARRRPAAPASVAAAAAAIERETARHDQTEYITSKRRSVRRVTCRLLVDGGIDTVGGPAAARRPGACRGAAGQRRNQRQLHELRGPPVRPAAHHRAFAVAVHPGAGGGRL